MVQYLCSNKDKKKMLKDKRLILREFPRKDHEPHTSHIAHNFLTPIIVKIKIYDHT
jgi:hypothetical protein